MLPHNNSASDSATGWRCAL